jgi:hypothetical protein
MMHSKTENKRDIRKTVDFDIELYETIDQMATIKNCSFSYACYVLLQSAIREKQRKKKNRSENFPDDTRSGHAE